MFNILTILNSGVLAFCLRFFVLISHICSAPPFPDFVNTHQIQSQVRIHRVPQNTSFSLLKLAKPENDVCQCAVYSRGSHPHDAERFTPQQQSDQHHLLLHRAASLITSSPKLPFPFFSEHNVAFLTGCALIAGWLACLDLVQTKHG